MKNGLASEEKEKEFNENCLILFIMPPNFYLNTWSFNNEQILNVCLSPRIRVPSLQMEEDLQALQNVIPLKLKQ